MLAVHERMTDVEVGIAGRVDGADLVVIDGPLRGRPHIDHADRLHQEPRRARTCPTELHPRRGHLGRRAADAGVHGRRRRGAGTRGTCGFRVRRARRGRASCGASARPTSRPPPRSRSPTRRPRRCPGSRRSRTRTPARRRTFTRSAGSSASCAIGWGIKRCCTARCGLRPPPPPADLAREPRSTTATSATNRYRIVADVTKVVAASGD